MTAISGMKNGGDIDIAAVFIRCGTIISCDYLATRREERIFAYLSRRRFNETKHALHRKPLPREGFGVGSDLQTTPQAARTAAKSKIRYNNLIHI